MQIGGMSNLVASDEDVVRIFSMVCFDRKLWSNTHACSDKYNSQVPRKIDQIPDIRGEIYSYSISIVLMSIGSRTEVTSSTTCATIS